MKKYGIVAILLVLLFSQIQAQELEELQSSLATAQSPAQKIELLNQIAHYYVDRGNIQQALVYNANAIKTNKYSISHRPFWSFFQSHIAYNIKPESSLDSLKTIIKSLDKTLITNDLLNLLSHRIASIFYSEYSTELANEALEISIATKDTIQEGFAYFNIGFLLYWLNNLEEAEANFLKAFERFDQVQDTTGLLITLRHLGWTNYYLYNLNTAEKYTMEAMELSQALNDPKEILETKRVLLGINEFKGNLKEATRIAQSLVDHATENQIENIRDYSNLALILYIKGNFIEAKPLVEKTIDWQLKSKRFNLLAQRYQLYADCLNNLGIYDSAAIYYKKTIQNAREYNDNYHLYMALRELSLLYFEIQDTTRAMAYAEDLEDYLKSLDQNEDNSAGLRRWEWKTSFYDRTAQLDSAIFYVNKKLNLSIDNNLNSRIPYQRIELGHFYLETKKFKEAAYQFQEALIKAKTMGLEGDECLALYKLSALALAQNDIDKALNYGIQSLELAKKLGQGLRLNDVYEILSEIYSKKRNYESAYKFLIKLDSLENQLYGFVQKDRIAKYEAMFRMKEKELENEQMKIEQERKDYTIQQRTLWVIVLGILILLTVLFSIWYSQRAKLNAQNKLRKQLTRDIHDEVGGILNNLKMNMEEALDKVPAKLKIKDRLAQTLDLSNYATDSLENLIWKVEGKDSQLDKFEKEIKNFTQYYFSINEIPYHLETEGLTTPKKLPFFKYYHLSMIFKEALQNVLKHSNRKGVDIQWKYQEENLFLQVKNQIASTKQEYGNDIHRGLTNMKERVASIKGQIEFKEMTNFFILELEVKLPS